MSGANGLIPVGNGLFINPITGTYTTGTTGQSGSPVSPQGTFSGPAQAAPGAPQPSVAASLVPTDEAATPVTPGPSPSYQPSPTDIATARLRASQAASGGAPATTPAATPTPPSSGPTGASTGTSSFPQGYGWLGNLAQFESGGNPNATNPNSTASGLFQFTNGTFGDFLNSPVAKAKGYTAKDASSPAASSDAALWYAQQNSQALSQAGFQPTPGDLVAAHILGPRDAVALKKAQASNPNATLGSVLGTVDPNAKAVFAGNAGFMSPDMTVSQFLMNTGDVADGSYLRKVGPAQLASNGASDFSLTGPSGTQGTSGPGSFMSTYQQMMGTLPQPGALPKAPNLQGSPQLLGTTPSVGDQGLAFAAGLLGGHSFGQGLSQGFENLLQTRQQQNQVANEARTQTTALNNAASQGNFQNQLGLQETGNDQAVQRANTALQLAQYMRPKPLGYMPVQTGTDDNGKPIYAMPMQSPDGSITMSSLGAGVTPGQFALQNQKTQNQTAEKQSTTSYQQSAKAANEFDAQAPADAQQVRVVNNALVGLDQNGGAIGPTVRAKVLNFLVTKLGLPAGSITPNGLALTQNAIADSKLGDIGNLRNYFTQLRGPELQAVKGIMMGEDVNPEALRTGLLELQADVQARMKIRSLWDSMGDAQKTAIMQSPGGFSSWQSQQYNEAYVDPTSPSAAPNVPAAFDSKGTYTGTAGVPAPAKAEAAASSLPRVMSNDDYNSLPSGATFMDPQGNVRRKP